MRCVCTYRVVIAWVGKYAPHVFFGQRVRSSHFCFNSVIIKFGSRFRKIEQDVVCCLYKDSW